MRTVYAGGQVFDGTGAPPAAADVVVEDGRFVDIGPGLDGDEGVDCAGTTVLPGLFDCHVHVMFTGVDLLDAADAVLATVLRVGPQSARDAGAASPPSGRRRRRPRRRAGRPTGPGRRAADADLDQRAEPDRRARRRLDALGLHGHAAPRRTRAGPDLVDGPDESAASAAR